MILFVKYHPRFGKQCEKLLRSNDKASKAVISARKILSGFKTFKMEFNRLGTLTHYGELRLKDGIKYDLGNGYRLVLSLGEDCLYVHCVGSHDQCNKWLERNRGVVDFCYSLQEEIPIRSFEKKKHLNLHVDHMESDDFSSIEDRILRQIFQGICNNQKQS